MKVTVECFPSVEGFLIGNLLTSPPASKFPWKAEITEKSTPYCFFVDIQTQYIVKLSAYNLPTRCQPRINNFVEMFVEIFC